MRVLHIISLIISTSCIEHQSSSEMGQPSIEQKSQSNKNHPKNKIFKTPLTSEKYFNFTKRRHLNLTYVLEKYDSIEYITVNSGDRGSVSFGVDELGGSQKVSVIYAENYDIFIKNKFGEIFHERIK